MVCAVHDIPVASLQLCPMAVRKCPTYVCGRPQKQVPEAPGAAVGDAPHVPRILVITLELGSASSALEPLVGPALVLAFCLVLVPF